MVHGAMRIAIATSAKSGAQKLSVVPLPRRFLLSSFSSSSAHSETFASLHDHREFLTSQSKLPDGFSVSTRTFGFHPAELPSMDAKMTLTLLTLTDPAGAKDWTAMFTRNAFPGSPVIVGRERLKEKGEKLRGIVVNNKISNVFPGGDGVADAYSVAAAALKEIERTSGSCTGGFVLPSSTGVIGWRIPVAEMVREMPQLADGLQEESVLPAAEGIMTTDLYPKVRSAEVTCENGATGKIVAIAKGAGMVEPNMATMLVYVLTDVALEGGQDQYASSLSDAVNKTFNCISVDSDTSTSDTTVLVSSGKYTCSDAAHFNSQLFKVCRDLSDDVVRNGEGVTHVIRVNVAAAPSRRFAVGVGRAVVNSPLFKCAVHGNDPNVGRLVGAIGKYFSQLESPPPFDPLKCTVRMGDVDIFKNGHFDLDADNERKLHEHMKRAQMYESSPEVSGPAEAPSVSYSPPQSWPAHKRCVDIEVDLGMGVAAATVLGSSLSHEYVCENADYRS